MSNIIKPTVGRKVWYRHNGSGPIANVASVQLRPETRSDQPMDATIIHVWDDRLVNLRVTDHVGNTFYSEGCNLLQFDDEAPLTGHYCQWMPYQVQQQARSTAFENTSSSIDSLLAGFMTRDSEEDLDEHELALAKALAESDEVDYLSSVVTVDDEEFLVSVHRVSDDTSDVAVSLTKEHIEAREDAGLETMEAVSVGAFLAAVGRQGDISICHGELSGQKFGVLVFDLTKMTPASLFEAAKACIQMQGQPLPESADL